MKQLENRITAARKKLGTDQLQDVNYTHVIWMSNFQMLRLKNAENIYVDGSFDVDLKGFKQLVTILAVGSITEFGTPIVFIMLDSKIKIAYELAFQALKTVTTSMDTVEMRPTL